MQSTVTKFASFAFLVCSTAALAAPAPSPSPSPGALKIEITSWRQVEPQNIQNTAAEVCGTVTGTLTGQERILITVDPNGDPGEYTTLPSAHGNFCQVVNSYTGNVEADIVAPTSQIVARTRFQRAK